MLKGKKFDAFTLMLEAGLISQQQYDDKVAEVLSRM